MTNQDDCLQQIDELLALDNQIWLFGAGISAGAGIPLMSALTERVISLAEEDENKLYGETLNKVRNELSKDAHIEHMLSHLADYAAIAQRTKSKKVKIMNKHVCLEELQKVHNQILYWIAETIRWGYKPGTKDSEEVIGKSYDPKVIIDEHRSFIDALFNRTHAGMPKRRVPISFFTTNYDTLLEDSLALERIPYWDGFSGGAVAFRYHSYGDTCSAYGIRAKVIKLHGSIDWRLVEGRVCRVRDADLYPREDTRVLIFPQATKYLATQRDPFASQFDLFRTTLKQQTENTLAICGYGFGDEHINKEIEIAMSEPNNKTTVIAFSKGLNDTLKRWQESSWARRLYIVTANGVYAGDSNSSSFPPKEEKEREWWTFAGVTKALNEGMEAFTN